MNRFLVVLLAGLLFLGITHSTWSAEQEPAKEPASAKEAVKETPAPTYVGNEVCQACHPDQFQKFSQSQMG